jgi:hypothetical protein
MNTLDDAISTAVGVFRTSPDLNDEGIYRALLTRGIDRRLAARLVEFLPSVYCRLILRNTGAMFSDTFRRSQPPGTPEELPLSSEPVWNAAVAFANAELQKGVSSKDVMALAARSPEFDAANQLLHRGAKLEDVPFTSLVFPWPENGPDL